MQNIASGTAPRFRFRKATDTYFDIVNQIK